MAASATIDRLGGPLNRPPSLSVRLRARLRAWHLDHELAQGVDPGSDPALALRAQHLLNPESRARTADSLEEALHEAGEPVRLSARLPLLEKPILAARPELESLAAALRAHDDCQAQGVALARLLITDGASPLYGPGSGQQLVAAAGEAYRALRPGEPR